jgi:DNA-binding NtrC family response regulator
MIVDDDEPFRTAISRAMRARGYTVEEAKDGADALKAVKAATPDVLVTDLLMPASDGVELIGALRSLRPALPIIAMSGRPNLGGLDLLSLATSLGAASALQKPFSIDELVDAVAIVSPASPDRASVSG